MAEMYVGVKPDLVQREWGIGLADYRPHEIARGLVKTSDAVFAPNLGEFKRMCRPALDPEIAWYEAIEGLRARENGETGQWSHPAVWRATHGMSYHMLNQTYAAMRRRWEVALDREFAKGWVEDVPPIAKQIEHRLTGTLPSADVRERMDRLIRQVRGK
jgi:hypothetical protein